MTDNVSIRPASGAAVNASTDLLSDNSHSPKVSILPGNGNPTPISPATTDKQDAILLAVQSLQSAQEAYQVTPANDADLSGGLTRGVYVGTGGDLSVVMAGQARLFKNVPDGASLPIRVTRVRATGTTAADILALY